MKLLKKPETVSSSDRYYDLFEGYIDPQDFVVKEDADEVDAAVEVIKEFFKTLEDNELLEEI